MSAHRPDASFDEVNVVPLRPQLATLNLSRRTKLRYEVVIEGEAVVWLPVRIGSALSSDVNFPGRILHPNDSSVEISRTARPGTGGMLRV